MNIFIQHGYGKSEKIDTALNDNLISGIIFNPKYENVKSLKNYIIELKNINPGIDIIIDTQSYLLSYKNVILGKIEEHGLFEFYPIDRMSFSDPNIKDKIVENHINTQIDYGVTKIASPSVVIKRFDDAWSQIFLDLSYLSINYLKKVSPNTKMLITLVVSEDAFDIKSEGYNNFLNYIINLDVYGFYLIISKNSSTKKPFNLENLDSILKFIFVLTYFHKYEVYLGNCDIEGLLFKSAGLKSFSTGWFNNLSNFCIDNYINETGEKLKRRPSKDKYFSGKYLKYFNQEELIKFQKKGNIYNDIINENSYYKGELNRNISFLNKCAEFSRISQEIDEIGSTDQKIIFLKNLINQAIYKNEIIEKNKKKKSFSYLKKWKDALEKFEGWANKKI